ncbi:MAG: BON domain-containing protein [Egibacteraceae bacterium]
MAVTDEELDRIREALDAADGIDATRIDLDAEGDGVVLRGAVASPEESTVAGMLASQHVAAVRNELGVEPNLREDPTDDTLGAGDWGDEDDPARATQLATEEHGGDITDRAAEAQAESIPWEPPHEPVGVPTTAEERGELDHKVGAVDSADPGPLPEDEAEATSPSLADLSAEELRRSAHGSDRGERDKPA